MRTLPYPAKGEAARAPGRTSTSTPGAAVSLRLTPGAWDVSAEGPVVLCESGSVDVGPFLDAGEAVRVVVTKHVRLYVRALSSSLTRVYAHPVG